MPLICAREGVNKDLITKPTAIDCSQLLVIGVDEVGRGTLMGNVVAAAVLCSQNIYIEELNDSKKLSVAQREKLAIHIRAKSLGSAIGECSPSEIDALNILQASLLAMQRAVEKLMQSPEYLNLSSIEMENIEVLIDGNKTPTDLKNARAIIKGDATVPAISCASIIAKVYRDKQMIDLDRQFPSYGFAHHKGYPTKLHIAALQTNGIIPNLYRLTFNPVKKLVADKP